MEEEEHNAMQSNQEDSDYTDDNDSDNSEEKCEAEEELRNLMDFEYVDCDDSTEEGDVMESSDESSQSTEGESDSEETADVGEKREAATADKQPAKKRKLETESISTIPQKIISKFYGRYTELESLQSAINPHEKTEVIDIAVTGITGVGKTELVLKFIQENSDKFKHLIWIDSKNMETFQNKLLQLALYLDIVYEEFDITIDDNFNAMLQLLYKELNQYKTLIVFDNADVEIETFMPRKEVKNIMLVVTTQISDIECNEKIELECFDLDIAIEMLADNIDHKHIDLSNLQKLATALGYHPLALDIAIKYYDYQLKMLKLEKQEFCVVKFLQLLTSDAKKFINFIETPLNNDDTTLYNAFKYVIKNILEYDDGKLALDLLCYISYMGNKNIDIEIFNAISDISNELLEAAVALLQKYSLVTVKKSSKISTFTIIQFVIRHMPINDNILDSLLAIIHFNMVDRIEGKTPTVANHVKPHIMKIFNDFASASHKKEYSLMFLESSYTRKETNYRDINKMYEHLSKYPEAITIEVQCLYVELLIKCKKYEEVIQKTDKIIKENYKEEFDIEIYGLLIWYYRSYALNELNGSDVKTWKTCKWTFIRMSEHMEYNINTFKCLSLLTKIAIQLKDDESYVEYCKNVIEHIIGTYIDWTNTTVDTKKLLFMRYITLHLNSTNQTNVAVEFINNMKTKIQYQIDNTENNEQHKKILELLNINLFLCLIQLEDYHGAFGIITSTYENPLLSRTFLFRCISDFLQDGSKYKTCCELLKYRLLNHHINGFYKDILNIIKNLQTVLSRLHMNTDVIELYDALENAELRLNTVTMNPCIVEGRLYKALFICENVDHDESWNVFKTAFNGCSLYDRCKHFVLREKPATKSEMEIVIYSALELVECILTDEFDSVVT